MPGIVPGPGIIMISKVDRSLLPVYRLHLTDNIQMYKAITIPSDKFYDGVFRAWNMFQERRHTKGDLQGE